MFFRQKGKPKRKSRYKILDATDQESLELKPTSRAGRTPGAGAEGPDRVLIPHVPSPSRSFACSSQVCFSLSVPVSGSAASVLNLSSPSFLGRDQIVTCFSCNLLPHPSHEAHPQLFPGICGCWAVRCLPLGLLPATQALPGLSIGAGRVRVRHGPLSLEADY